MEDETEPNWDVAFTRWRAHVDRLLDPDPPAPGDPAHLVTVSELLEDNSVRWAVYDSDALHGAVVAASDVATPEQVGAVTEAFDAISAEHPKREHPVRTRIFGATPPPADTEWIPDYELFPELGILPGTATPTPSEGME